MITPPVLEKILSFLAPLFLDTAKGDPTAARDAASAILGSYEARTPTLNSASPPWPSLLVSAPSTPSAGPRTRTSR